MGIILPSEFSIGSKWIIHGLVSQEGQKLNGHICTVENCAENRSFTVDNNNAGDGDGSMDAAPVEIYIGNLDFNTRDQDLEDEFRKEVPNLIEARVVMDKFDNRRSRGFAFAKVATQEEADKLVAKYNEFELGGTGPDLATQYASRRTIRVNIAGQKSERPSNRVTTSSFTGWSLPRDAIKVTIDSSITGNGNPNKAINIRPANLKRINSSSTPSSTTSLSKTTQSSRKQNKCIQGILLGKPSKTTEDIE